MNKRSDYVKYRLEKAEETYEVALLLVREKKWNSAVNRFYYACFYAISALLVQSEIETKSHSGVKTQFFLKFIKKVRFPQTWENFTQTFLIGVKREIMETSLIFPNKM